MIPGNLPGAVATDSTFISQTLSSYKQYLNVAHINAQSLKPKSRDAKFDEFSSILDGKLIDVMGVSESWLKPYISNAAVGIAGYRVHRNDRVVSRGGGVAIYVKKELHSKVVATYSEPGAEALFIQVSSGLSQTLVGVIYLPGRNFNMIEDICADLVLRFENVVIMGDFNTDVLLPRNDVACKNVCDRLGLEVIHNNTPTHFDLRWNSSSLIDFFLVSSSNFVKYRNQFWVPGISHHACVFISIDVSKEVSNQEVFVRDYNNINSQQLVMDICQTDFSYLYSTSDPNLQVIFINNLITNLYNTHVPLKRIFRESSCGLKLSPQMRHTKSLRDLAFKAFCQDRCDERWKLFCSYRNKFKAMVRKAKLCQGARIFGSALSTRQLWRKLKCIGGSKGCGDPLYLNELDLNNLNHSFISATSGTPIPRFDHELQEAANSFSFKCVSEVELEAALYSLCSNAVGLDNISLKFIKTLFPLISQHFLYVFNSIFTTSKFPDAWKRAKIIPIPKGGSGSEFRPISILPVLSKVFEKLVSEQLMEHLTGNKLLYDKQSGFRKKFSTTATLVDVTDRIRCSTENKKVSILLLLDFSKAFDSIDFSLLLGKLKTQFAFSNSSCNLIYSYLTNRDQCVSSGKLSSSFSNVYKGVPQGSILGPLLFSLFINDLASCVSFSMVHLFADDVQLLHSLPVSCYSQCVDEMNLDLASIYSWASINKLLLNPDKSKAMLFNFQSNWPSISNINLNGITIPIVDQAKSLGLLVDNQLTWEPHINGVVKNINLTLRKLYSLNYRLPTAVKFKLVQALIMSTINYCLEVYSGCTNILLERIQRSVNCAVRYIYNLRYRDHVSQFVIKLLGTNFKNYVSLRLLLFFYKTIQNQTPDYLLPSFNFSSSSRVRNIVLPRVSSSVFGRSFNFRVSRLYNCCVPVILKRFHISPRLFKKKMLAELSL